MFNKNFYPTPEKVIKKMLDGIYFKNNEVLLEPSAGKGDILNYLNENKYETGKPKIYCIEKNPDLQSILRDNYYKLLGDDFLEYEKDMEFDYIIMNPPFDRGDEHFLKAWEIAGNTTIVCLLNAETIKNPFSKRRQLVAKILQDNGAEIEYLGDCFSDSERKTDVNVAMIKVVKKVAENKFDFDGVKIERDFTSFSKDIDKNLPATQDLIQNLVDDYHRANELFLESKKMFEKAETIIASMTSYYKPIDNFKGNDIKECYFEHIEQYKSEFWQYLTQKIGMDKFMTSGVRKNFDEFVRQQGAVAITKKNIEKILDLLVSNKLTILEKAIPEVFDYMTSYYEDNRLHIEGWKTNDKWKVNKKIIFPYFISEWKLESWDRGSKTFSAGYSSNNGKKDDIDKVMCFISGKDINRIETIESALRRKFEELGAISVGEKYDNTLSSTFFDIKFFKKGTVHLKFKDDWLWEEFNIRACKNKNWLPEAEWKEWQEKKKSREIIQDKLI